MQEDGWNSLPRDILQTIGTLLNGRDLREARLACSTWRQGISWGVQYLRPRTVPNAGALAAAVGQPAKLTSFPNIATLDLRRTGLSPFQIPQLRALNSKVSLLQIAYLERVGRPGEYFAQLQDLYEGLAELARKFNVEAEIHVEQSPHTRSYGLTDRDLVSIAGVPSSVALTKLQIGRQLTYEIRDISPLTYLTTLRSLDFVTYGANITDFTFLQLSRLSHLTSLHFGTVTYVTGAGLSAGLAGCAAKLQDLGLVDCSTLQNGGLAQLTELLPQLTQLSLIRVPWLTDSCIRQSLTQLTCLSRLQLADNSQITCGVSGLQQLQHMPLLRQLDIRRFDRIGPDEVDLLLSFPNIELVNDRAQSHAPKPELLSRMPDGG